MEAPSTEIRVVLWSAPPTATLKLLFPCHWGLGWYSAATPGSSRASDMKLRPFNGRFWIRSRLTTPSILYSVVLTCPAWLVTSTTSELAPTLSLKSTLTVDPVTTVTVWTWVWKLVSSDLTSHSPTFRLGNKYVPVSSDTAWRVMPSVLCVAVIDTPGITAPDSS